METKSRYEVISDLEQQKRNLIKERDSFVDQIEAKEKQIRLIERQRDDNTVILNRQVMDAKEDLEKFKKTILDQKATIAELIASVDQSLERLGSLSNSQKK